jgi:hypothetical protein
MTEPLNILLIIHLAGLIMGFVGGRSHAEVMKKISAASPDTAAVLWEFEKKASWTAFLGTALLVISGASMLWLKYDGPQHQPPLFWVKIGLVALVAVAEIMRHITAVQVREGNAAMLSQTRFWGKTSGIAAVAIVVIAVLVFGGN